MKTQCKKIISFGIMMPLLLVNASCGQTSTDEYSLPKAFETTVLAEENINATILEDVEKPFINRTPFVSKRFSEFGDVNVDLENVNYWDSILSLAKSFGYFVQRQDGVDKDIGISVRVQNVSPAEAIRKVAEAAGYVAVFYPEDSKIIIGTTALRVYRLPENAFISQPVSALAAENDFGSALSTEEISAESVFLALEALNVPRAQVRIAEATGLISISGDVIQLRRAHRYITELNYYLTTNVKLDLALLSVSRADKENLNSVLSYINSDNLSLTIGNASSAQAGGISGSVAKKDFQGVLSLLGEYTKAQVINELSFDTINRRGVSFFSGFSVPHVSEISQQTDELGNVTITGQANTVQDGIWVYMRPEIVAHNHIIIHLLPKLNSVERIDNFNFGENQLSVPVENLSEGAFSTKIVSGKTTIVGGLKIRINREAVDGLPSENIAKLLGSSAFEKSEYELWIVLQAKIDDSNHSNPLVAEDLL